MTNEHFLDYCKNSGVGIIGKKLYTAQQNHVRIGIFLSKFDLENLPTDQKQKFLKWSF